MDAILSPEQFVLPPHACISCNMPNVPAVDFDRPFDDADPNRELRVYLCRDCIAAAAVEVGLEAWNRGTLEAERSIVAAERQRSAELALQVEHLRGVLSAVADAAQHHGALNEAVANG